MHITLSPIASDHNTHVSVSNDALTIDNIEYDFCDILQDGQKTFDDMSPFIGPVKRVSGEIHCEVIYFYDNSQAASEQQANQDAYCFDVQNGQIPDPIIRLSE